MTALADAKRRLAEEAETIEAQLRGALSRQAGSAPRLDEAIAYSLLGGGKRLRPALCLWIHDARRDSRDRAVWNAAVALEMIHTYSLIHDDLPSMDDDDLRRGQPSCHKRFDEATAILAGDALQSSAFERLAEIEDPELSQICVRLLARGAGRAGMAAGQQWDLDTTGQIAEEAELLRIHRLKTGSLLGTSIALGAACADMREDEIDRCERAGVELGIAFQMVDDVLDEEATAKQLGKSPGKDREQGKLTVLRFLDAEQALLEAEEHLRRCEDELRGLELWSPEVQALCGLLVHRDR